MSLPAIGDAVTVLFNGDAAHTISGALFGVPGKIIRATSSVDPHAWWKATTTRETHYIVRAEFEGIYWMRGEGREVEAALIASYALWSST